MNRRQFLATGVAVGAAATWASAQESVPAPQRQFKLKYAPHFGMFESVAGKDLADQLRFMHDQGFTAMEDNGMKGRSVEDQERVANEMQRLGMTMGVFVAQAEFNEVTFASNTPEIRAKIEQDMRQAVEVAKRVNTKWCTVVPGHADFKQAWDYQTANVVDNLKRAAEICEPSGLVMVIEPLNEYVDCPGIFLTKIPQAYLICRAVGSPSCKILFDMYHQQVTEGNIIPNMDRAWEEVAYFQIGDNPGRNEPTTGEMNYRNIFRHIHEKGYTGLLGMEHGNSKPGPEGARAVVDAYAACDGF